MVMKCWIYKLRSFLLERRIQISSVVFFFLIFDYIREKNIPYDILEYPGYIGSCLVVLGVLLRTWAAGIITKNKKLVTYGPYSFCRHPLYLGTFLISLGFVFLLNDLENIMVIILFTVFIYMPKIKEEERKLYREFKDSWEEYVSKTSSLMPNFSDIKYPWSFKLWVKNKEHYTFFGCLFGLVLIKIWNDFYF